MRINKRLVKSQVETESYTHKEYVDMRYVPAALGYIISVLFAAFIVLCFTVPFARHMLRKPGAPPKVITKVIHDSSLSSAQKEYIKQCEDVGAYHAHGIPDVHTNSWTCQIPKD